MKKMNAVFRTTAKKTADRLRIIAGRSVSYLYTNNTIHFTYTK